MAEGDESNAQAHNRLVSYKTSVINLITFLKLIFFPFFLYLGNCKEMPLTYVLLGYWLVWKISSSLDFANAPEFL